MQTIVFEGQDRIVLQEKPIPSLDDGDVLIQVDLCGVCASDIAAINGEVTDYSPPVVLGHEIAGVIVESRHPEVRVDQKVTVNPLISCGACDYCRVDLDKYLVKDDKKNKINILRNNLKVDKLSFAYNHNNNVLNYIIRNCS